MFFEIFDGCFWLAFGDFLTDDCCFWTLFQDSYFSCILIVFDSYCPLFCVLIWLVSMIFRSTFETAFVMLVCTLIFKGSSLSGLLEAGSITFAFATLSPTPAGAGSTSAYNDGV